MNIFKDRFLILSLLLGLSTRLILTPIPGFKFDVDTWFAWAQRLHEVGFLSFYSDKIWTGYPPGFLYILSLLGFIKNLFQISDSNFYIVLKLPSIIAEIILGAIIYQIIPDKYSIWKKLSLFLVILNPAFIFNSAIFGQFDGLFSLVLVVSIYFLTQKRIIFAAIFWAISFLLKPQAIILSPVFFLYILKNFSPKNLLYLSFPFLLTIFIGFFPFFIFNPIKGPIDLITNLLDYYPYGSIFAYNFWGIFGFWIPDNKKWLDISYQNIGFILLVIFWVITGFFYFSKKVSLFTLSSLSTLSFFFLLTRMHERYLYPALVFMIIFSILKKSKILTSLTIILSSLHLLDLYYVYIYYNQFYLKIPQTIYYASIYNFADKNIPLISFFSTLIFFLISINILKLNDAYEKN